MYADDILITAKSKEELEIITKVIAEKFKNFGVKLAESKTVTMTWNTTEDIMEEKTLISVNGTDLQNIREFRYLGHTLTNKKSQKIPHRTDWSSVCSLER